MTFSDLFLFASRHFRARRMQRFHRVFQITNATTILDVGGTPSNWVLLPVQPRLTILNLPRAKESVGEETAWVAGDGRSLPFQDRSFDVVFSNSVIEHLRDATSQSAFAKEIARVGVRYFVQTPNRWFPVETHLLMPILHFLPKNMQRRVIQNFTVWGWVTRASAHRRDFYIQHYLNDVRLLDYRSMQELFPKAIILKERFLGLTKSLIAVSHIRENEHDVDPGSPLR